MVELIDDLPKCSWHERVSGGSYLRQPLYSGRRNVSTLEELYCGIAKPGKVAAHPVHLTSLELSHPSRAAQLEPSGTKQEPSQHAVNNTCIATWSQVEPSQSVVNDTCSATWNQLHVLQKLYLAHLEPSGTKQEPSQRAVNNTCTATWDKVEPSGTKRGTKQNFNPSYAIRTV